MITKVKQKTRQFIASLNKARVQRPLLFWLRVATIVLVTGIMLVRRSFWTPDTLFIIMLSLFVVFGQARAFLVRFVPFVLLLLAYDSFRAIADDLNSYVNFWAMIDFDRSFFGVLPTITLQQWWWHGSLQWYDFYFYFLYTMHFVVPLALAILIWKKRPALYWQFVLALVGLSFAAFITYIVFPAAPPWMASEMGLIEPLHRISTDLWFAMGISDPVALYKELSPNLVAAVPSLHSAYPLLAVMFIWKLFGFRRTWWALLYPVSMWIGVVYLGEHYVFDVVFGAGYAVAAYFAASWLFKWLRWYEPTFKADYTLAYARARSKASRRS